MHAEFGVICLIATLFAALLPSLYLIAPKLKPALAACIFPAAWVQALLVTLALTSLVILRIESDFSVENIAHHSNLHLPMLYKIVGTWGNHEGSMLLWVWVLAIFGALLAINQSKDAELARLTIAVQSALLSGTVAFVLFTSNPFTRIFPPPADGRALNPLLQDIGLALHPPLLYFGYVGFSIVFSLAVASLILGRGGKLWANIAQPWILTAWSALTLGIGLGSWWAYRELGWGGWWFWDPVENASLLPWLSGTALLHANIVLKKRGALGQWVILLSILTFAMSMIGTFLVRSGVLTSVHSFASDPERGMFILAYIVISVGAALLLFALRSDAIKSDTPTPPASREGMIVVNNLFLITACGSVLLGTLYPLASEWLHGAKLTIGAPYFNLTFIPLMVLPIFFAGLAPFMAWKNASFYKAMVSARASIIAVLAATCIILAVIQTHILYAALGFGLAIWLGVSSLTLLRRKPLAPHLSVAIAHLGVALLVAGITGAGLWKSETEKFLKPGDTLALGDYSIEYTGSKQVAGDNFHTKIGNFTLTHDGQALATLTPEYRHYIISNSQTSETAIYAHQAGDIYAVIGEDSADGKAVAARLYHIPMIHFIWLGFVLMAIGGVMGIMNRKGNTVDPTF